MPYLGRFLATGALVGAATVAGTVGAAAGQEPASSLSCSACGHNLVLGPGAEAGPGTNEDAVVKVPYWKPTGGFTAAQYAWSGGDLSATTPGPKNRGKNYFYGGPDAARSTGTQVINVPAAGVAGGRATFVLSGWLGGYSSQGDNAAVYVTFASSAGSPLAKATLGPVTEAQRDGTSELLFRRASGPVPAATRTVVVKLVMSRTDGSDNDGMADNLSLVFSAP
jgi:hypothetical protein